MGSSFAHSEFAISSFSPTNQARRAAARISRASRRICENLAWIRRAQKKATGVPRIIVHVPWPVLGGTHSVGAICIGDGWLAIRKSSGDGALGLEFFLVAVRESHPC